MREYNKIQTVYKRDPETKFKTLLIGEYSLPEFQYLENNLWAFTEKVDGTNIRVDWDGESKVRFGGRTDNAQIPTFLYDRLIEMFHTDMFVEAFDSPVTLYGEGYGAKIQKGGGKYKADGVDFVLFDVKCGDFWLKRVDVKDIANKLSIETVPVIGVGTLPEMVEAARTGIVSKWGDFPAEGIVARPVTELFARNGNRIITKIKTKDFKPE